MTHKNKHIMAKPNYDFNDNWLSMFRFKCTYSMNTDRLELNHRNRFLSLIKEIIHRECPELYHNYYVTREIRNKPFTFSIYFPNMPKENNFDHDKKHLIVGDVAELHVSGIGTYLGVCLYNGLTKIKKYNLYGKKTSIKLEDIFVLPPKMIQGDTALFKTRSPILLNKKYGKYNFILPGTPGASSSNETDREQLAIYNENLAFHVNETAKLFLGLSCNYFTFVPLRWKKKVVHRIHNMQHQLVSAFSGEFLVCAPSPILNLIYYIGLGIYRSQGFGMIEYVTNIE